MTPEQFQRVEEIFHEAVALPAVDRTAFLDRATNGDGKLRGEVESLLAADGTAGERLASVIGGIGYEDGMRGRRVGPYRVVREIGRGGMGVVFEAIREGEFSQKVALKVSTLAVYSPDFLERFRQERQILAGLTHPYIARLIDGGSTDDGVPFLAMEFVDGVSIREYAKREALTPRACCQLFLMVSEAVDYAHQNLIVHRDLKPANILVDDRGDPKLLDFGVAKLLDAGHGATATVTRFGPATPDYSSPEQILGQSVTTRTDVYQLGLILYELIAGQRAQSVTGTSLTELQQSICEGEIAALSIGGDLATIVATALQRDPARRYANVAAFSGDLNAWLTGHPIAAQRDSVWHHARKFVRRNWLPVSAAALLFLTLLGGIATTLYQARRAERRFDQVRGIARALLYDVHESIQPLPASIDAQQMVVRTALQYLDGLANEVTGDQSLQREVAAGYSRIGTIQAKMVGPSLGQRVTGLASFSKAVGILAPMHAANPGQVEVAVELADIYSEMAEIAARSGQSTEAKMLAERAITVVVAAAAANPGNLLVRRRVARAYVNYNRDIAGRDKVNLEFVLRPVTELEKVMELSPSDPAILNELAQAYLAAGTVYFNAKRPSEALAFMEKAVRIREQEIASKPESALVQRSLMLAYAAVGDINWGFPQSLGNREVAVRNFEKMFQVAQRLREQDPKSKSTAMDIAFSQMRYGSALEPLDPQSMELLTASLSTLEGLAAADTKNMGLRRQMIDLCIRTGERHMARGAVDRAIELFRKGIAISDEMAAADAKNVGARTWGVRSYLQLAAAIEKTGRKAESASLLRKAKIRLAEAQSLDAAGAATLAKPVAEWEARLR